MFRFESLNKFNCLFDFFQYLIPCFFIICITRIHKTCIQIQKKLKKYG